LEQIEFRDAVYEDMINIYDDVCLDYVQAAFKGRLNSYEFNAYAAMIFGCFLGDVYTENYSKFIELVTPLYEEYRKNKIEQDADHRRTLMKIHNLEVIK